MYYVEVYFKDEDPVVIKSIVEELNVEKLVEFFQENPNYNRAYKEIVTYKAITLSAVKKYYNTDFIHDWPVLTPNKKVNIRGAWIKQNYSTTGDPVKYGIKIEMTNSSEYYGEAYFYTYIDKAVIEFSYHFKTFSEASDKLSLAIIKHMIENPILTLG